MNYVIIPEEDISICKSEDMQWGSYTTIKVVPKFPWFKYFIYRYGCKQQQIKNYIFVAELLDIIKFL